MNEDFIELRKLQSHAQSIFEQAIKAIMSYKAIKHIPLNMHICSDNLGNLPTVSVVANKFQELTSEIQASIKRFESATSTIRESIKLALFSVCASKLNHEMASSFQDQSKGDSEKNYEFEISQLIEVFSKSKVTSLEQLQNVINLSNEILSSCENLRNVLLGLDLIRVSGRIEIAKMNIQNDNLTNFMNELMVFKSSVLNSITQISNCAERIQSTTLTLSEVG